MPPGTWGAAWVGRGFFDARGWRLAGVWGAEGTLDTLCCLLPSLVVGPQQLGDGLGSLAPCLPQPQPLALSPHATLLKPALFSQHGGVRGTVYPTGHHGERAAQVSRQHPTPEEPVRARWWVQHPVCAVGWEGAGPPQQGDGEAPAATSQPFVWVLLWRVGRGWARLTILAPSLSWWVQCLLESIVPFHGVSPSSQRYRWGSCPHRVPCPRTGSEMAT